MFLCMTLCLAPIALPLVALAVTLVMSLGAPVYPVESAPPVAIEVPVSAPAHPTIRPVSAPCRVRVDRFETRAYPYPLMIERGIPGERYSGAPSHSLNTIEVF